MAADLKRRLTRAGGLALVKRLIKPVPIVGTALLVGLAAREVERKGPMRGSLDLALDLMPVVGTAKAVVEIFTGDLIPDKKPSQG